MHPLLKKILDSPLMLHIYRTSSMGLCLKLWVEFALYCHLMSPLLCLGKKTTRFLYRTIFNSNVKKDNTPPVCAIALRCDKDINYCRFMARCMARVAPLITITIPGSSGASRSINCDLLFHRKSLFLLI